MDISYEEVLESANTTKLQLVQIDPVIAVSPHALYKMNADCSWGYVRSLTDKEKAQVEAQRQGGIVLSGEEGIELEYVAIKNGFKWYIGRRDNREHVERIFDMGTYWTWVKASRVAAHLNMMFRTGIFLGRNYKPWIMGPNESPVSDLSPTEALRAKLVDETNAERKKICSYFAKRLGVKVQWVFPMGSPEILTVLTTGVPYDPFTNPDQFADIMKYAETQMSIEYNVQGANVKIGNILIGTANVTGNPSVYRGHMLHVLYMFFIGKYFYPGLNTDTPLPTPLERSRDLSHFP